MVAVFSVKTEPKPGVCTKHIPGGQQRAGREDFRAFQGLLVFGITIFGHVSIDGEKLAFNRE